MHSVNHDGGRQLLLVYFLLANAAGRPARRPLPVRVHVAQALAKATGTISKINMFRQKKSWSFAFICMALPGVTSLKLAYVCM
jgi:hypothetical protein